jgi:hypothetical protein
MRSVSNAYILLESVPENRLAIPQTILYKIRRQAQNENKSQAAIHRQFRKDGAAWQNRPQFVRAYADFIQQHLQATYQVYDSNVRGRAYEVWGVSATYK